MIAKLLLATAMFVASAVPVVAQEEALRWAQCAQPGFERFECGTLSVPLDHSKPRGAQLGLAVLRQRAGDPAARIGTLVVAAVGPGSSALDAMRGDGMVPSAEVARRFDIVTFDQRGIGRTRQVSCHTSAAEQEAYWLEVPLPPADAAEEREAERDSRRLARGCARHSEDLVGNLTTTDVARDMERLRKALGEKQINFSGGSYASYVGAVYGRCSVSVCGR